MPVERYINNILPIETRRKILREILGRTFPIVIEEGSLASSESFLKEGKGVVIAFNHFSKGDVLALANLCLTSDEFISNRDNLVAIGAHHYNLAPRILGCLLDVNFSPVSTPNTSRATERDKDQGKGLLTYLRQSAETLRRGGIIALAANAERRPTMGEPGQVFEIFTRFLERKGVTNFGFQPIGLGLRDRWGEDVIDYSNHQDFNRGYVYVIRIGRCISYEQAKNGAEEDGISIDAWLHEQIRPLVPASYRESSS